MWQIFMDIAGRAWQWVGSIALVAAGGNESLAAAYVIGISAVTVAVVIVLIIVLLRYANGLADDGICHRTLAGKRQGMMSDLKRKRGDNARRGASQP